MVEIVWVDVEFEVWFCVFVFDFFDGFVEIGVCCGDDELLVFEGYVYSFGLIVG